MADLKIKSSKFMVNVNFNSEPREQVFIRRTTNNNCLVVLENGIKIQDKNGVWSEEISFKQLKTAFGEIKP